MKYSNLAQKAGKEGLTRMIEGISLTAHVQPILSLKNRSVIGYEGLIRGIREEDGSLMQSVPLFETAKTENRVIEMDRLCREVILNQFATIFQLEPDFLIFINVNSSLLEAIEPQNSFFLNQMAARKIDRSRVVIEITESKESNLNRLLRFVEFHRTHGFLVALDDVGAGTSDFDRIPAIKPDFIKIDQSIVKNMEKDDHKQEIFKALGNLARKTGTLVVAKGVETEEEAMWAIELDADLAQGYYFAKPQPFREGINEVPQRMASQAQDRYRRHKVREIKSLRSRYHRYEELARHLLERIRDKEPQDFDKFLGEMIGCSHYLEALYILDTQGILITETVLNKNIQIKQNKIFRCAQKGDDLSLKKYFFLPIDIELEKYISESYISSATGNLCRTISILFKGTNNQSYLLCMDISERNGKFIYLYN
jgi:EAL domain-containing protein (putative c-di-GMP-specific phosphodiesterase class I)